VNISVSSLQMDRNSNTRLSRRQKCDLEDMSLEVISVRIGAATRFKPQKCTMYLVKRCENIKKIIHCGKGWPETRNGVRSRK
jgi:hypothetical protein